LGKDGKITEEAIIDFLRYKNEKYYKGAIKKYAKFQEIDINWDTVKEGIKSIKRKEIKSKELSFEEVKYLVNNLEYPYNKIVLLQFEFGARIREIMNLEAERLSKDKLGSGEETIKAILKTKGNKSRVVFTVSNGATAFLSDYIGRGGLVFPRELFVKSHIKNHDEEMIEERTIRSVYWNVWHIVKEKAKELFNKNIATHWFRHSRIIYLYNKGWDIRTIQRFTGHSSLDMVQKYLISAGADTKKIANEEKKKGELEW